PVQHPRSRITGQQRDGGIGLLHGLAESSQPGLVILARTLVADLPIFDAIGFRMAALGPDFAQRRIGCTVEIFHLVRGILGRARAPLAGPRKRRTQIRGSPPTAWQNCQIPSRPGPLGWRPPQARKGLRRSGSPTVSRQSKSPRLRSSRTLPPKRMMPGLRARTA